MPYELSTFTLPGGARALRANAVGDLGKEDVTYFLENAGEGKPYFGLPILVTTHAMGSLSAEARNAMARDVTANAQLAWCAMVMINPVVRVMTNFLMRINRHPRLKVFGKEQDAIRWLDERALEDAAKKPA